MGWGWHHTRRWQARAGTVNSFSPWIESGSGRQILICLWFFICVFGFIFLSFMTMSLPFLFKTNNNNHPIISSGLCHQQLRHLISGLFQLLCFVFSVSTHFQLFNLNTQLFSPLPHFHLQVLNAANSLWTLAPLQTAMWNVFFACNFQMVAQLRG